MYLSGSLALGDFDPQGSDIDFVVVTAGELPEDRIAALSDLHALFDAGGSPWVGRIEAVYIPREALRDYHTAQGRYPQVEKGTTLFVERLESGWIFQCYTLRERGVVVTGPDPRTLINPVDPDDMRRAAAPIAEMWLNQSRKDPSWLDWARRRENQAFVVLTLCRLLYTLDTGSVTSKPAAGRWARKHLGSRWADLIAGALDRQHDRVDVPDSVLNQTVEMARYAVERFRQWATA